MEKTEWILTLGCSIQPVFSQFPTMEDLRQATFEYACGKFVDEVCACGNSGPWLTLEGRTDDILTFGNGVKIAPLSIYAILKEVHGIERFQLIQHENDRLELRLIAENKEEQFAKAKQAVETYLHQNGVTAEIYLSDNTPSANPISGKFKHIIAKAE